MGKMPLISRRRSIEPEIGMTPAVFELARCQTEARVDRFLVTGFGAFGTVEDNPSAWLAEHSGEPFRVLEVSYAAVETFLETVDSSSFDLLLCLGVAANADLMRLELVARNKIGKTPDVLGIAGPSSIDLSSQQLSSNLWTSELLGNLPDGTEISCNAGDYLCNFLLFKATRTFPDKKVGFLHVVQPEVIPLAKQLDVVQQVIASCRS